MNLEQRFLKYKKDLDVGFDKLDIKLLKQSIAKIKEKILKKKTLFVCGNGGSTAISNHFIADYLKLLREKTKIKVKIISLVNNFELLTSISNDISYDKIFSYQLESLANKNDLLICISSSGNSNNIVSAIKFAKKNSIFTIGFSGFNGGYLKKNCDISLHFENNSYQLSEDFHHILMHFIMNELIEELK